MGLDINNGSYFCHACRGPVYATASRCPHCTSPLGMAGSNPDPASGDVVSTVFLLGVSYVLIGAIVDQLFAAGSVASTLYWAPGNAIIWIAQRFMDLLGWFICDPGNLRC